MERLSLSVDAEPRRECKSPIAKWRHVNLQDLRLRSQVIGMSTGSGGSGQYLSNNSANSGSSSHHNNRHNATFADEMGGQPDMAGMPHGLSHKMRGNRDYTEAWWSMGEFLNPGHNGGLTHQSTKFSLTGNRVFSSNHQEELWDLSDSLAELHDTVNRSSVTDSLQLRQQQDREVNIKEWLESDVGSGFIRVYPPNVNSYATSYLIPCTLTTTAHQVCLMLGISLNSLHVQYNGDIIQRLETYEHPLMMQNEYLVSIGYCDLDRIQEEGTHEDLGYLIRFYYGKPTFDSTFSRKQLQAYIDVRKGKMLQQWVPRMCVISGTRLLIYKDKYKRTNPNVVQLAKGAVEEVKFKGHSLCLKLTSTLHGEKYIYLSFTDRQEYDRWHRKCKKATDKLPTSADLSNCHLEFLPETIFINDQLAMLNLRHNVLKERPIEEDIYTIGWLDDLHKFMMLRSLNLADNNLKVFPQALCHVRTLVELNIASNKLEEIPAEISELSNLQALHVHNNHLRTLPGEMISLRKLFILVLAFNHFEVIPAVVPQLTDVRISEVENIIMAGNQIQSLPAEVVTKMRYVKKADFRMNDLTLPPSEVARFTALEHLTHLDIRDNRIDELDIRVVKTLEYLNCERNAMYSLQVNGTALKNLLVAHNYLDRVNINPKPEWLLQIDVSYNQLKHLPEWLSDCFFLQKINACHNALVELPSRLLVDGKKLKSLRVNHNRLMALPAEVDTIFLEEIYIQHNLITQLPDNFLRRTNKLRVLNATKNRLLCLPPLNENQDLNKVQELYLTCNALTDSAMGVISGYSRLKLLHIAHNDIEHLSESDIRCLEMMQELNICGNQLRSLPASLGELSKLTILRAHSNALESLPDFKKATSLRVLDVGHNHLLNVSVTNLMASQLNLLDMSLNRQLKVDPKEFKTVKNRKSVCLVDLTGQNRTLPGLGHRPRELQEDEIDPSQAWKVGFSETPGTRNKLSVAMLKILHFGNEDESVFAVFDGGYNDEVPKILVEMVPGILREELKRDRSGTGYMRYTFLTAHKMLKGTGQKLGASGALCHIRRVSALNNMNQYTLHLGNVGDIEVVLCRRGEAVVLTRKFVTTEDDEECLRVYQSDGIITEDNKVSGTTKNTRLLGCSYLSPHVIPDPHLNAVALRHDDEFIIIANRGLWKYVAYNEAIEEVYEIGNPIVAAKKLQDLAQGYGSRENISILIVRFNTDKGPSLGRLRPNNRSMSIDDVEAAAQHEEQRLLKQRKREISASNTTLRSSNGKVQRQSHGGDRRRTQYSAGEPDVNAAAADIMSNGSSCIDSPFPSSRSISPNHLVLKPLPNQKYIKKNAATEWDGILQKRLTDDVKDKEMKQVSSSISNEDVFLGNRRMVAVDLDINSNSDVSMEKIAPIQNSHVITRPWANEEHATANPAYTAYADDDSLVDSSETMMASNHSVKNVRHTIAMFENITKDDSRETVSGGRRKVIKVERDERTPYVGADAPCQGVGVPKVHTEVVEFACDSSDDSMCMPGMRASHNNSSVVTADIHRPQYRGSVESALHKRQANCDVDTMDDPDVTIVEIARL